MAMEITELFDLLMKNYPDVTSAFEALQEQLQQDEELAEEYGEWCGSQGYSLKKGFAAYYQEAEEHRDSIWDSIYPNREEYDGYN